MKDELFYRVALTMIPALGPVCVKALTERFGDASSIFGARKKELAAVDTIGVIRASQIKSWNGYADVEKELKFISKHHIQPLFLTDPQYPQRLLHCYDPPSLLYYKGNADLNHARIISIIGTRNNTAYGKKVTEELVAALKAQQVLIMSGLAFGIDAIAHKACIEQGIATVGVLAHGLDTIYPQQHNALAKEMLLNGGLLTEFRMCTQPDKHHFPRRNRIVAGMSDATIVIETAIKGGSMITAELAHNYNRDLFAIPGKIYDTHSSGCLQLIQQNKAILLSGAEQLIEVMGWVEKQRPSKKQTQLFIELTKNEELVVALLKEKESMAIDELYLRSGLSSSAISAAILNLEMQNVIKALPGKLYGMK